MKLRLEMSILSVGSNPKDLQVSSDIIDADLEDKSEYAGGKESIDTNDITELRLVVSGTTFL